MDLFREGKACLGAGGPAVRKKKACWVILNTSALSRRRGLTWSI